MRDFLVETQTGKAALQQMTIHVDDAHMKQGKLDRNSLDLIARMGGIQYTRTTLRFEMVRPNVG